LQRISTAPSGFLFHNIGRAEAEVIMTCWFKHSEAGKIDARGQGLRVGNETCEELAMRLGASHQLDAVMKESMDFLEDVLAEHLCDLLQVVLPPGNPFEPRTA
jgi:hypothetical protein